MSEQSNIKTWPERIYLQHGDSPDVPPFHEVYPGNGYSDRITWCQDKIEAADVEYVRADVAAAPVAAQEPVGRNALALSIAELEKLAYSDEGDLTPSQAESILLVLHELSRLQASQPAQGNPAITAPSGCNQWLREQGAYAIPRTCRKCGLGPCAMASQPAQEPEPDEPCDNCGLSHPSSNCIYKPAPARPMDIYELAAHLPADVNWGEPITPEIARHILSKAALPETWKVLPSPPAVITKIDAAIAMVSALCDGSQRWTMSVPARPDSDPDLVIAGALQAARDLIGGRKP